MKNLFRRVALPLVLLALSPAAHAGQQIVPQNGDRPALSVEQGPAWDGKIDDEGNLVLFKDDHSGFVLLRVIPSESAATMPPDAELAKIILESAGAKPYSSTRPSRFAGGSATSFVSTLAVNEGPLFNLVVTLRRVDPTHVAVGATGIVENATPDQKAQYDVLMNSVQVLNR